MATPAPVRATAATPRTRTGLGILPIAIPALTTPLSHQPDRPDCPNLGDLERLLPFDVNLRDFQLLEDHPDIICLMNSVEEALDGLVLLDAKVIPLTTRRRS